MSRLRLLLALGALVMLVVLGVLLNASAPVTSMSNQPMAAMNHSADLQAASVAERKVMLRGLGMA